MTTIRSGQIILGLCDPLGEPQAVAEVAQTGATLFAMELIPRTTRAQSMDVLSSMTTLAGYRAVQVQDEAFYQRQRELLGDVVAESDVVITTAAIPGKQSPLLVTAEAVARMQPGSVIVDLGAERGGNCALTKADERVVASGVTILGPTNLPSEVPYHASQMFSANVTAFLLNLAPKGQLVLNCDDPIIRETLVAHEGQVVHPRLRELLGLAKLEQQTLET
jgi:NAD(P) transhydrogenase subunit alpha